MNPKTESDCGFSLMEALIAIAVIGIVAAVAMSGISGVTTGAQATKLESDVSTINQAIDVYTANGGSLEGITKPQDVLDKLKTARSGDAAEFAGLRGVMLDKRLAVRLQTTEEAATESVRAIWVSSANHFMTVRGGVGGVKEFYLDETLAAVDFGTEDRDESSLNFDVSERSWIWEYDDAPSAAPPAPTLIPVTGGNNTAPVLLSSGPAALSPPLISPNGGAFHYQEYNLPIFISNPNSGLSSWIMVSTGGAFSRYTGPIAIGPDTVVQAYVAGDSNLWTQSPTVSETFTRETYTLQQPLITPSSIQFDGSNQSVTVSLSDPNPSGLSTMVYWLSGQSAKTNYSGPFTLNSADYPSGVTIYGQSVGTASFVADSSAASQAIVNADPVELDPPSIELSSNIFNDSINTITITLTNPKPTGSSEIFYAIKEPTAGYPPTTSYLSYGTSFDVTSGMYPEGFHIQAYAKSLDTLSYIDSDFAEAVTIADFFGVALTGDVQFIIDASGSMNIQFANTNRFDRVIQETVDAINSLSPSQKFSLAMFSSGVHWTDGSGTMLEANAANKASIVTQIQSLYASGGTNYRAALGLPTSLDILPTQVIMLSDGLPNYRNYMSQVSNLASLGIPVDTVGIGNPNSQAPLQEIATLTAGSFRFISEPGSSGTFQEPVFSLAGNRYDYTSYPMTLSLSNPNPAAISYIRYSINDGSYATYSGPLSLAYDTKVTAYVASTDSAWAESGRVEEIYGVRELSLDKPGIALSSTVLYPGVVDQITVTLNNPNNSSISELIYWFEGQNEATEATTYGGPFQITAANWNSYVSSGSYEAKLRVRAVGTTAFATDSAYEEAWVGNKGAVPSGGKKVVMEPPTFSEEGDKYDHDEFPITLTIINPNTASGSIMVSINGGTHTAYTAPIQVGFNTTVDAFISPTNTSSYLASDTRTAVFEVEEVELDKPDIDVHPDDEFDEDVKTITVTATNPNLSSVSQLIYWFEGEDEATEAKPYTGPIVLEADNWESYIKDDDDETELRVRAIPATGTESFVKESRYDEVEIENDN
ncbi:MAG: VWA domain-containing protein [Verrucomicrobiota bacterium]